jgi:formylglycine-generating enzyme required for sulfatase activity
LSQQAGLPTEEWCYIRNKAGVYAEGMEIPANALERTGYRLPTEAEWEYACRAGTVTARYYGHSVDLLRHYGWFEANSLHHAWPAGKLLPNDLGLFDMLGNAIEWCQDRNSAIRTSTAGKYTDITLSEELIMSKSYRVLHGGSFFDGPSQLRAAATSLDNPANRNGYIGFRVARTLPSGGRSGSPKE